MAHFVSEEGNEKMSERLKKWKERFERAMKKSNLNAERITYLRSLLRTMDAEIPSLSGSDLKGKALELRSKIEKAMTGRK